MGIFTLQNRARSQSNVEILYWSTKTKVLIKVADERRCEENHNLIQKFSMKDNSYLTDTWINKGDLKELIKMNIILDSKGLLKQHVMGEGQKYGQFAVWKRLILIVSMLFVGSIAALIPSQAAYAQSGWSQPPFICWAGHGGNGGIADNGSSGANGATGGDCVNGPRGGDGASGGQNNSPGGPGGNVL